jgi:hypothetical protein
MTPRAPPDSHHATVAVAAVAATAAADVTVGLVLW